MAVSADGTPSIFASGFENLYGSDVLTFGGDGSLYVLDPGGSESITNSGSTAEPRMLRISSRIATGSPAPRISRLRLAAHSNPFNPRVELSCSLPSAGHLRLDVYAATGRHVVSLLDEDRPAGTGRVRWDGHDANGSQLSSGVYHTRIRTSTQSETVKLTLVR